MSSYFYRVVHYWKAKNTDNMIRGYKMNLQQFLGTRVPNAILNIVFKFRFSRKVSTIWFEKKIVVGEVVLTALCFTGIEESPSSRYRRTYTRRNRRIWQKRFESVIRLVGR